MNTPINKELYNPELLRTKLGSGIMRSDVLLANMRFLDVEARKTSEFSDPKYFPFYYYLGQQLHSQHVVQIGSQAGLVGSAFLQGCRTVESWLSMDVPRNQGSSLANVIQGNLSKHCGGKVGSMYVPPNLEPLLVETIHPKAELADTVFVSEKFEPEHYKIVLEFAWKYLIVEGILIADYIATDVIKPVFESFCRVKNREPLVFDTRYGVGIIQR